MGTTTTTKKRSKLFRLLVPAFVFQSVVIGGGYGTGAEINQYFLSRGLAGGLVAMIVTTVIWAAVCVVTFEFASVFKTYDYKRMMDKLLGKAGFLYEICYIVLLLIVLGVVTATAGSMVTALTGSTPWIGIAILSVGIVFLVLKGTRMIENVLTIWSYVLYAVYVVFMVIVFSKFGDNLSTAFAAKSVAGSDWFLGGAQYAFYNLGIVPALLYTIQETETRKEAVTSGFLAGVIGVLPALMLLLAMATHFEAASVAEVPVTVLFEALDMRWLYWLFEIVLFGTLIETGTGFIKALDDRVENSIAASGKEVPKWVRPAIAVGSVIIGILISTFGLTALIAKGYGAISWGFLIIFVIPMFTIGVYKIRKHDKQIGE